jgi:hypothetical protein
MASDSTIGRIDKDKEQINAAGRAPTTLPVQKPLMSSYTPSETFVHPAQWLDGKPYPTKSHMPLTSERQHIILYI